VQLTLRAHYGGETGVSVLLDWLWGGSSALASLHGSGCGVESMVASKRDELDGRELGLPSDSEWTDLK